MMKANSRLLPGLVAAALSLCAISQPATGQSATAQASFSARDLAGWWSVDPVHGGETSHLALQFIDKDGKQEAHLSLPGIGDYDINLGEVTITGNSIDTRGLAFALTWDADAKTLSGIVPAEAAPIYKIPVEFRRGEPLPKPAPNEWKAPRPKVRWTLDTGAPVWAGIELSEAGTLFVGNDNGVLSAISRDGKRLWTFETGKPIRAQPLERDGAVYLHSDSGFVYKLNSKTGEEQWRAKVDAGSDPRLPVNEKGSRWDRYGSSVVYGGGDVYVASRDKNLYALNPWSGKEEWRVAASDIMTATPVVYGDLVIFGDYSGKVTAVTRSDGKPRWTFDAGLAITGNLALSRN